MQLISIPRPWVVSQQARVLGRDKIVKILFRFCQIKERERERESEIQGRRKAEGICYWFVKMTKRIMMNTTQRERGKDAEKQKQISMLL
jgi:hypothetical protein